MSNDKSFGYTIVALIALVIGCFAFVNINQKSDDGNMSNMQVESVHLIDSIEYRNPIEVSIGIPTSVEMRYNYEMKLTDENMDTTMIRFTTRGGNMSNIHVGDKIKLYNNTFKINN